MTHGTFEIVRQLMTHSDGETKTRERVRAVAKEPPLYRVLLLNDHYTSMDFVVWVLQSVFRKSATEAFEVMLRVHREGSGLAGVYTKDIAETKAATVESLARQQSYPLRCSLEPAGT